MILGNLLLYMTAVSCTISIALPLLSKKIWNVFVLAQFSFITMAILKLANAHINLDYSLANVVNNTHDFTPILYRISGIWGNHEGSMLLLLWCFSLVSILQTKFDPCPLEITTQSSIVLCLTLITIFTSNPFLRSDEIFPIGKGLNPLLQDIALAIHPPVLYFGYALTSIPFSISLGCLLKKDFHKLPNITFWTILSWGVLSAGIGLGSWWSYRELGWGGFWFWDPLENVSLVSWLAITTCIHLSKLPKTARSLFYYAVGHIITFLLVVFGLFLVRSGILNSIHSFAFDAERGTAIFLMLLLLSAISLWAIYKHKKTWSSSLKISLPLALTITLLMLANLVIILGISYPIFYNAIYDKNIVISEGFYTKSLSVIFLPLIYIGTIYASKTKRILLFIIITAIILTSAIIFTAPIRGILKILFLHGSISFLSATLIYCTSIERKKFSAAVGHFGFALLIFSSTIYYSYSTEQHLLISKNSPIKYKNFEYSLEDIIYKNDKNFLSRTAIIMIKSDGKLLGTAKPEIRFYPAEKSFTTESSIIHNYYGDLYFTMGELSGNELSLNIKFEPFIYLIWLSIFCMLASMLIHIMSRHDPTKI